MKSQQQKTPVANEQKIPQRNPRPNESSGLNIDEFVRISDPQTKEVFLEKRA